MRQPCSDFSARNVSRDASDTIWTVMSSPATPPPSPTLVRSVAANRWVISGVMPADVGEPMSGVILPE